MMLEHHTFGAQSQTIRFCGWQTLRHLCLALCTSQHVGRYTSSSCTASTSVFGAPPPLNALRAASGKKKAIMSSYRFLMDQHQEHRRHLAHRPIQLRLHHHFSILKETLRLVLLYRGTHQASYGHNHQSVAILRSSFAIGTSLILAHLCMKCVSQIPKQSLPSPQSTTTIHK